MVCFQGIRVPQQSTDGELDGAGPSTCPGGGGDSAGLQPQRPPGATAGPA